MRERAARPSIVVSRTRNIPSNCDFSKCAPSPLWKGQNNMDGDYSIDPAAQSRNPDIKGFTPVPNWILMHPDLGRIDIAVYLCLAYHADNETGYCWPSVATIMGETKIGNRETFRNSLHRLAGIGAVYVYQRTGQANLYVLPDRKLRRPDDADGRPPR